MPSDSPDKADDSVIVEQTNMLPPPPVDISGNQHFDQKSMNSLPSMHNQSIQARQSEIAKEMVSQKLSGR